MKNIQNSLNNQGAGNVGNNINAQEEKNIIHQAIPNENKNFQKEIDDLRQKLNEYQVALNKMQQEIDDLHNLLEEKKKYNPMNWIVAIFGLSFLFFLFAVFLNWTFNFGISDNGIVLTFVGIAATFIVVSNYAQVKDIEGRFKEKVAELNKTFDAKVTDLGKTFDAKVAGLDEKIEENKIEEIVLKTEEI
jgi:hypothetical protein